MCVFVDLVKGVKINPQLRRAMTHPRHSDEGKAPRPGLDQNGLAAQDAEKRESSHSTRLGTSQAKYNF